MKEPSYLTLIRENLDWNKVQERLCRYKYIAELFPITDLQNCCDKPPYYCHYLSWRLGTWHNEELFKFFDKLLETCTSLPGWNKTRIQGGCEFGNFWSFIWELQVAVFFADLGMNVEWLKSGPDLQVSSGSDILYVECTTCHKSFGLEEFIGELFRCISEDIRVEHVPFLIFSLPKNNDIGSFLDELFSPYLELSFLPSKMIEVQNQSPILLPVPSTAKNFYVYLENMGAPNQDWDIKKKLFLSGDPKNFLRIMIEERSKAKNEENALCQNHPNLLMVNFLLGRDWQSGIDINLIQKPDLGGSLDGIFMTACGINELPTFQNSLIYLRDDKHPIELFKKKFENAKKTNDVVFKDVS
jgi:hypothetical protein